MRLLTPFDHKMHSISVARLLNESVKKATRVDEDSPKDRHIAIIIDQVTGHTNLKNLSHFIVSTPLLYKPPVYALQAYADAASPYENSVYTKSSGAYKRVVLEGLQVFKALYLLHKLLDEHPASVFQVASIYSAWMNRIGTQIRTRPHTGGKGYNEICMKYAEYLQDRLEILTIPPSAACESSCCVKTSGHTIDDVLDLHLSSCLRELRASLLAKIAEENGQRINELVLKLITSELERIG